MVEKLRIAAAEVDGGRSRWHSWAKDLRRI